MFIGYYAKYNQHFDNDCCFCETTVIFKVLVIFGIITYKYYIMKKIFFFWHHQTQVPCEEKHFPIHQMKPDQ